MRPVELEVAGFGAFRDPVIVDFRDLDLFAFVGPTGSGKSTLIDAVTFALYGVVARYDDARLVAPAISALATEARVRLDFTVGDDTYTAVRVVRRTAKGATTREARLERDGEVLAGSAAELTAAVERLLGLDFGQFTKTVVLPQGEFAEFLHQKAGERQALLRRLFALDVYERVGARARERAKQATNRAAWLRDDLAGEGEVTDADVDALAARLDLVVGARTALADDLARLAELATACDDHDRAEREADAHLALVGDVVAPDGVGDLADALAGAQRAEQAAEAERAAARVARRDAEDAAAAGPDVATCRALLDRHQDRDETARRLADAQAAAAAAAAALAAAADDVAAVQRADEAVDAAVEQARAVRQRAQADRDDGPDVAALDQAAALHDQRQVDDARRAELEEQLAELGTARADAEGALDRARQAEAEAATTLERVRMAAGAAGLVAVLSVGEPCPVCRQPVVALPDHDVDAEVAVAEAAAGAARRATADADAVLAQVRHDEATCRATADEVAARLVQLDDRLAALPALDDVAALRRRADELAAAVAAAERAVAAAEAAQRERRADPARQQVLDQHRDAERTEAAAAAAAEQTAGRLAELDAQLEGAAPAEVVEADLARSRTLAEAATAARARADAAEAEYDAARAATRRAEQAVADADAALGRARDRLAPLAPPAPAGPSVADRWAALLAWIGERVAALDASRAAARQAGEVARREHDALAQAVLERASATIGPDVRPVLRAVGEVPERLAEAETGARLALEGARVLQAKQAERRAEVAEREAEAAVAAHLGQLLSSRGFEAWLLEEAVADLVERASERLHELSAGQYSLVADGTEFAVRDHRNADEVRDAKTLSGGETFLASLALALALAESVTDLAAEGAARLESIFLDEGFGTLDPETLDVVATAIEELGASGRMVGIVTHLRDLADRVPVRLEVTKGPTTSTVARVES